MAGDALTGHVPGGPVRIVWDGDLRMVAAAMRRGIEGAKGKHQRAPQETVHVYV